MFSLVEADKLPLGVGLKATKRVHGDVELGVLEDLGDKGLVDLDTIKNDFRVRQGRQRPRLDRTIAEVIDRFSNKGLITVISQDTDDQINGGRQRYQLTEQGIGEYNQASASRLVRSVGIQQTAF
jgi:hypothetical protein